MSELKITLMQHTPILHFQHDQEGATLRATELKPKLDRFMLEHLENPNRNWFISGEEKALNYKIHIKPIGEYDENVKTVDKIPTFFANMGNGKEKKYPIYYKDGLEIIFFSLHNDLLTVIKKNISEFFLVTNFGTRQSKGFGSFYPAEISDGYISIDSIIEKSKEISNCRIISYCYFTVDVKDKNPIHNQLFKSIDYFTRMIRGGISICKPLCFREYRQGMPDRMEKSGVRLCNSKCCKYTKDKNCIYKQTGSVFYLKSLLYKYLESKGVIWDKKTIKDVLDNTEFDSSKRYLYRDLLGLACESQYGNNNKVIKSNNDVERFSSPIFIKPIKINEYKFKVYVGYRILKNEENILNKQFNINLNINRTQTNFNISTPKVFNLEEYFNYIFTQINIDECIGNKQIFFKKRDVKDSIVSVLPNSKFHKEYELITRIFGELKSNYKKQTL